jgi:hypothetical protein
MMESNLIYSESTDFKCLSHLKNTFTANLLKPLLPQGVLAPKPRHLPLHRVGTRQIFVE